jgi:hypothetical protein
MDALTRSGLLKIYYLERVPLPDGYPPVPSIYTPVLPPVYRKPSAPTPRRSLSRRGPRCCSGCASLAAEVKGEELGFRQWYATPNRTSPGSSKPQRIPWVPFIGRQPPSSSPRIADPVTCRSFDGLASLAGRWSPILSTTHDQPLLQRLPHHPRPSSTVPQVNYGVVTWNGVSATGQSDGWENTSAVHGQ